MTLPTALLLFLAVLLPACTAPREAEEEEAPPEVQTRGLRPVAGKPVKVGTLVYSRYPRNLSPRAPRRPLGASPAPRVTDAQWRSVYETVRSHAGGSSRRRPTRTATRPEMPPAILLSCGRPRHGKSYLRVENPDYYEAGWQDGQPPHGLPDGGCKLDASSSPAAFVELVFETIPGRHYVIHCRVYDIRWSTPGGLHHSPGGPQYDTSWRLSGVINRDVDVENRNLFVAFRALSPTTTLRLQPRRGTPLWMWAELQQVPRDIVPY